MPKVSVIIPVYNAEKTLHRCVDSVLAQTFTDFELILINDGSTDNSGKICDEYAQKDSRIVVIHKENGGVSSARNKGINVANGEWISFVDSDDEYYNNQSLGYIYSNISDSIELVIGGYVCCNENGDIIYQMSNNINKVLTPIEGLKLYYKPRYYNYLGYTWIKLYNRRFLLKNNLRFNELITYNEDGLLHIQYCSLMNGNIKYTTTPFYKYYQLPSSAMGKLEQKFEKKFISDFDSFVKMYDTIRPFNNPSLTKMAKLGIINSYNRIIYMMHKFNEFDEKIEQKLKQQMLYKVGKFFYIKHKLWLLKCKINTLIYRIIYK